MSDLVQLYTWDCLIRFFTMETIEINFWWTQYLNLIYCYLYEESVDCYCFAHFTADVAIHWDFAPDLDVPINSMTCIYCQVHLCLIGIDLGVQTEGVIWFSLFNLFHLFNTRSLLFVFFIFDPSLLLLYFQLYWMAFCWFTLVLH